jgi:hypothetical protein
MTASKAIKDYCIKKEPTTAHKSKNNFSIKQLNKSQLYVLRGGRNVKNQNAKRSERQKYF